MTMQQGQSPTYSDVVGPVDRETTAIDEGTLIESSPSERAKRRFKTPGWFEILWENKKCRVGLVMMAAIFVIGIFAPVIAPYDPRYNDFAPNLDMSRDHLLGTTTNGEDVYSQLIWSTRTSLIVGIFGGLFATAIALVIGLTAGYLQGTVDEVLSFFINLGLVIPVLPLVALLASYSQVQGIWLIIFIIGITGWAYGARLKRAQIMTLRSRDYITAAKFAGDGFWRIIFREIMPNMMSLVVVGFIGAATGAIGTEAGLAFLGLGDPETVSWGQMTYWANVNGALVTGQWAWLLAPGLALAFLVTALTLINFGVDALSNPHLREV
jgi:peptide/nickel transport system permease protein